MQKRQDWELLRLYIEQHSQEAFGELTRRYLGLVYATCQRELGNCTLAEDTTQAVFLILARKAPTFRPNIILAAWLFDASKFTARNARREEQRRIHREQKIAMEMQHDAHSRASFRLEIGNTTLNEALSTLPKSDRQAVLLHYLCGYTYQEAGAACDISEEAARKRVERAIHKLKRHFANAGLTLTGITVVDLLSARTAQAASLGLEAKIVALVSAPVSQPSVLPAYQIAQGVLQSMKLMQWKIAAALGVGITLIGTVIGLSLPSAPFHKIAPTATQALPGTEDEASQLMLQMMETLSSLHSCSFMETGEGSISQGMPYQLHLNYERSHNIELLITRNGKTTRLLYRDAHLTSDGQAVTIPNAAKPLEAAIRASDVKADFVPPMLEDKKIENETKHMLKNVPKDKWPMTLLKGNAETMDGVAVDTIIDTMKQGADKMIFWIGHEDHFPRRISMTLGPNKENCIMTYSQIKLNPTVAPEMFQAADPASKP